MYICLYSLYKLFLRPYIKYSRRIALHTVHPVQFYHHFFYIYFVVWLSQLGVLRDFSWICAKGSLLADCRTIQGVEIELKLHTRQNLQLLCHCSTPSLYSSVSAYRMIPELRSWSKAWVQWVCYKSSPVFKLSLCTNLNSLCIVLQTKHIKLHNILYFG